MFSQNISSFIAGRLMDGKVAGKRIAGPAVRVATTAVAMGVCVMIISIAIGFGFKKEIRDKIIGFGGHIQIANLDLNSSMETVPLRKDSLLISEISNLHGVRHVQVYSTKPGIIKTNDAFLGIALKGIDSNYDNTFLHSILVEGNCLNISDSVRSDGILLSRKVATLLGLKLGDAVKMFFVMDGVRARRFTLVGIFDSHFDEYDKNIAFVDHRHIASLNKWDENRISGYEIIINNFDNLDNVTDDVASLTTVRLSEDDDMLRVRNIHQLQPQIFGWLSLLDKNIIVILVLIIAVAGLNMVSGLLILILEHTNTIGILKAIGTTNSTLRFVFIKMAMHIVGKGLMIGNIVGISLCLAQKFWGVIHLDAENYYLDTVPILLCVDHLLLLNIGVIVVSVLMLLGPSGIVARISPAKSIRFD